MTNGTNKLEALNSLSRRIKESHYGRLNLMDVLTFGGKSVTSAWNLCAPVRKQGSISLGGTSLPNETTQ